MSDSMQTVTADLEAALAGADRVKASFNSAVSSRASLMQATGVSISASEDQGGVKVVFSKTAPRGFPPAEVADKATSRLVEAGQQAMLEATQ